ERRARDAPLWRLAALAEGIEGACVARPARRQRPHVRERFPLRVLVGGEHGASEGKYRGEGALWLRHRDGDRLCGHAEERRRLVLVRGLRRRRDRRSEPRALREL